MLHTYVNTKDDSLPDDIIGPPTIVPSDPSTPPKPKSLKLIPHPVQVPSDPPTPPTSSAKHTDTSGKRS